VNIPNFSNAPIGRTTKGENVYLTPEWSNLLQQLFSELQQNVSNEGYFLPQRDSTTITTLDTTESTGAIIYDSDTNEFKGNVNGTYKVFLS